MTWQFEWERECHLLDITHLKIKEFTAYPGEISIYIFIGTRFWIHFTYKWCCVHVILSNVTQYSEKLMNTKQKIEKMANRCSYFKLSFITWLNATKHDHRVFIIIIQQSIAKWREIIIYASSFVIFLSKVNPNWLKT